MCLDYRACGLTGELQVVHIDQEWDDKIVVLATSFEAFIRGLEDGSAFDKDAEPRAEADGGVCQLSLSRSSLGLPRC